MSLFSTSNITCNERPSVVGSNFRDTINESASPINRFTEKVETRSFDEIFYEADIAIREASNSMNKLWYKSVLESDTVESAIINEANIFSKIVEVIKTIFDSIKKAILAWVKKARTLLQKIFKKKPVNKSDSKESSKDSEKASKSDVRSTDKESTPADKADEIESKNKTSTIPQSKVDTKSSSVNDYGDYASVLYNKYISDIEGNWNGIFRVFLDHYKNIKNGPKITPYIDLFKYTSKDYERDEINLIKSFKESFSTLYLIKGEEESYSNAICVVSSLLYKDSDNDIKERINNLMISDNKYRIEDYKMCLNSNISITDRDKDMIAAGFVYSIETYGLGLTNVYVETEILKSAEPWVKNLDNAFKGGEVDKIKAEPPVDKSISEFNHKQMVSFLENIRDMKKNANGYMLKDMEDSLKSIDNAKNTFIKKSNVIMNMIQNKTQEFASNTDAYQYYCNEFIPVIQKSIVGCISSVASVITQVFSMRIKIYTEAYTKANAWFESCLKLCIADELA